MNSGKDKFRDECGVFGVASHLEASRHAYLGLYALQHRGQESAGMVSSDGVRLHQHRGMGYVADVFQDRVLETLEGDSAIGHVRYSTSGDSSIVNAQPIVTESWRGPVALAHNGNIVNADALRQRLESEGAIFQSNSDSEVILHLLARSPRKELEAALGDVLMHVRGAYSLLMLTPRELFAIRDPFGVRPLCLGRLEDSWVVASETCAFDLIGADYVREVEPAEIIRIRDGQLSSFYLSQSSPKAHCIFEHVYFSRPDSRVFERSVHRSRFRMGRELAREAPVEADFVVPVPDSGVTAALGYAEESGIPFTFGLIRNHYVGRTFIEPRQSIRHFGVKIKLNAVREILQGKQVVLIDDSIVRGTTSRKIVEMVRGAGASKVHVRISSPPTVSPCHYGIDTPTNSELIANNKNIEEIREFIQADSLSYLSLEGLRKAVKADGQFCSACFDRNYPIPIVREMTQKELFQIEDLEVPEPVRKG